MPGLGRVKVSWGWGRSRARDRPIQRGVARAGDRHATWRPSIGLVIADISFSKTGGKKKENERGGEKK